MTEDNRSHTSGDDGKEPLSSDVARASETGGPANEFGTENAESQVQPEASAVVPAPASAGRRVPLWLVVVLLLIVAVQVALVVAVLRTGDIVAEVQEDVAGLTDDLAVAAAASPEATTTTTAPTEPGVETAAREVPVGFTADGFPYRGNPDAAVTLVEYSDYGCPFCGRYSAESAPGLLAEYVTTGDVRFVFRDFPLVALHPTAPAAHAAAWCAGEQGADLYWVMHDEIFASQASWTGLADPSGYLSGLAEAAGADMEGYADCIAAGDADEPIASGVAEARSLGFSGTPSFVFVAEASGDEHVLVGAQPISTFRGYLDALLAGEEPPTGTPPPEDPQEAAGLPAWADPASGLRPDPQRPGVNLAGDHYRGDPDAEMIVIEFSDFECPFCREHALGAQPIIDEALVATGDVLWVFKHLPLEIHPGALSAAVAAECAGDQGKFWEMHDLLFSAVGRWAADESATDAELVVLADEAGLDGAEFVACFEGRDALQRVLADTADASGIISSTPSFVVIHDGRGTLLEGALPPDQFIASLRELLGDGT